MLNRFIQSELNHANIQVSVSTVHTSRLTKSLGQQGLTKHLNHCLNNTLLVGKFPINHTDIRGQFYHPILFVAFWITLKTHENLFLCFNFERKKFNRKTFFRGKVIKIPSCWLRVTRIYTCFNFIASSSTFFLRSCSNSVFLSTFLFNFLSQSSSLSSFVPS